MRQNVNKSAAIEPGRTHQLRLTTVGIPDRHQNPRQGEHRWTHMPIPAGVVTAASGPTPVGCPRENRMQEEQPSNERKRGVRNQRIASEQACPQIPKRESSEPVPKPREASILRQAISYEVGDAACRGWIEVRQHRNDVAALWINLEVSVHPWGSAAVTEAPRLAFPVFVHETKRVFVAHGSFHFSGRQHFRVLRIKQLVIFQGVCESQQIFDRGVTSACRRPSLRQRVSVWMKTLAAHSGVSDRAVWNALIFG